MFHYMETSLKITRPLTLGLMSKWIYKDVCTSKLIVASVRLTAPEFKPPLLT